MTLLLLLILLVTPIKGLQRERVYRCLFQLLQYIQFSKAFFLCFLGPCNSCTWEGSSSGTSTNSAIILQSYKDIFLRIIAQYLLETSSPHVMIRERERGFILQTQVPRLYYVSLLGLVYLVSHTLIPIHCYNFKCS